MQSDRMLLRGDDAAAPAARGSRVKLEPGGAFHPASAPDYLPLAQMRQLQLQRLRAVVRRAYDRVELFRRRLDERNFPPDRLGALADIQHLPFTTKADLRDTYPFGLFASSMQDVVRVHASSGTTGKPIVVAYTQQDLDVWTSVMVRAFAACGLDHGDVVQNAYGYGLFTGGLGAHYGAEALGATVIPVSGGNTDRQIMVLKDFNVTAICCTPSYFIHLIERAAELGVRMRDLPLRVGIFGAEPWTESMRRHIEIEGGIQAFDIYGLSEIIGPGVGIECPYHNGLHIFEDHFYPEVIDPDTGSVMPDGEEGELVLTTLSKQAMPMIRYRTRDISVLAAEPCPCFPSQIEAALLAVEGALPHYEILLTRHKGLDAVEVHVEVTPELFSDKIGTLEALRQRLSYAVEHTLGLKVEITLAAPRSIQRSEGKAKRVIDRRSLTSETS
ncbi:MAG: phenylacetate--CoA ligase [Candidatus Solibacter sp.]|nr:phenylacetate--CoA ligase [Candidatus Solibacter sp.]